ncbi:MAG: tRNA (uridine(34)/cytosine(34)/5-carboxymethylaminomethyluridine(34)-2'-O)-methyltransferase TrmL [Firmicutes bacterium]|nr:tRNA (uridine(34)/cytosine(34)/5-carboxymethylaminomethyluridine(34)-2'-O)-methyltransferase TrmL [Dethiobacter sp.]MBS3899607.1 tRNA (uridine(34)/cytosine(34)/5-carboxymethylaminomethyluridine(34)-2'-O)-methyltransferase TrmL [Dethiobacter sp.]MCL4463711.1 tRNA (uridine(34)/cytosine(34)/5-carboxymethylaminomethyluridine(34)-2'-O)-methyltransferase TrmL [Bacillota bacterium]MCL5993361.1 tRNA (uridine(34)/cytosine(34)/5-carboxymethylaminomethyluridine(34)-2'-O)-methyltransferase TrmL [Bacillot
MHVVLVEPEIPPNTGNISRTCAVTGTALHLVGPLGFSIDDRQLKRAGLDYWQFLKLYIHEDLHQFLQTVATENFWFLTTHGKRNYAEINYQPSDFLVFGKETAGLPKELLAAYPERTVRIPMGPELRSLNLANSVAIVLYEALRQQGFPGLS